MKTKKYWVLTATVVAVFALQLWARIDINKLTLEQRSLSGINAMGVIVEVLQKDAIKAGLTIEQIQTDVELKLRREGIKIVSKKELLKHPETPFLNVMVGSMRVGDLSVQAVDIDINLTQFAFLERNPKILVCATTWEAGGLLLASDDVLVSGVREKIRDKVDEFLNDYYTANPKTNK